MEWVGSDCIFTGGTTGACICFGGAVAASSVVVEKREAELAHDGSLLLLLGRFSSRNLMNLIWYKRLSPFRNCTMAVCEFGRPSHTTVHSRPSAKTISPSAQSCITSGDSSGSGSSSLKDGSSCLSVSSEASSTTRIELLSEAIRSCSTISSTFCCRELSSL